MKKILVIGNGFDLHHYLPTRYRDFIDVVKRLEEVDKSLKICECKCIADM